VLLPVESIVDGTWGSGAPPAEFIDFQLMREMKWTYDELKAVPVYVQRYCWDFLQTVWSYEAAEAEKSSQQSKRGAR
jgi:hypothetical protein